MSPYLTDSSVEQMELGYRLMKAGSYERAAECFESAAASAPITERTITALHMAGVAHRQFGKLERACFLLFEAATLAEERQLFSLQAVILRDQATALQAVSLRTQHFEISDRARLMLEQSSSLLGQQLSLTIDPAEYTFMEAEKARTDRLRTRLDHEVARRYWKTRLLAWFKRRKRNSSR